MCHENTFFKSDSVFGLLCYICFQEKHYYATSVFRFCIQVKCYLSLNQNLCSYQLGLYFSLEVFMSEICPVLVAAQFCLLPSFVLSFACCIFPFYHLFQRQPKYVLTKLVSRPHSVYGETIFYLISLMCDCSMFQATEFWSHMFYGLVREYGSTTSSSFKSFSLHDLGQN
jgi:hypothetical protein